MKVNVLGTEYEVIFDTLAENKRYKECGGYSDLYQKEIHVRRYKDTDADLDEMSLPNKSMKMFEEKSLRHELVHAFMYESGLDVNSHNIEAWARDEEMIDWMAIQMPKIMKAYESVTNKNVIDAHYIDEEKPAIIEL